MPITYHVKPEEKLVVLRHSGTVTDKEFLSFYKALFGDPRFDKSFNLFVDLRQAESAVRGSGALSELAKFMGQQYENTRIKPKVVIVAPQDVSFGLARMYEAFSAQVPWEFQIVRTAEAALSWLGLPKELMRDSDQESQGRNSRASK